MASPTVSPLQAILNYAYNIFFLIHLPIMLLVDCYPFYPPNLLPQFMTDIRTFYIETYKDRFFTEAAPDWFWWFILMEALGHVPMCLSVYANGGVGGMA